MFQFDLYYEDMFCPVNQTPESHIFATSIYLQFMEDPVKLDDYKYIKDLKFFI